MTVRLATYLLEFGTRPSKQFCSQARYFDLLEQGPVRGRLAWVSLAFSRMRSAGFFFLSGGSGGGTVFISILRMISHAFAWSGRRCAVGIGGESLVWVALCRWDCWGEPRLGGAVPL